MIFLIPVTKASCIGYKISTLESSVVDFVQAVWQD